MRLLKLNQAKTKRKSIRLGSVAHILVNAILPIALYGLVVRELSFIALLLVLVSKWRTFAVTPRYWFANLRANAVDIIVGISTVLFMNDAQAASSAGEAFYAELQIVWMVWYGLWLLYIKPQSSTLWIAFQAGAGQVLGLSALSLYYDNILDLNLIPEALFIAGAWIVAVSSARHFLSAFEEAYIGVMSLAWGLIVAQLAWLVNRWLIVFTFTDVVRIPQFTILITLASFFIGQLYYLYKNNALNRERQTQLIMFGCAIILLFTFLSDWTGNV